MFGGHGIYCEDVMFGLVDSSSVAFLRVDDEVAADLTAAGGSKPSRMADVGVTLERSKMVSWQGDGQRT